MGVGAGSTLESDADVAAMTDASPEDFGKRGKNASLPSQAAPYGAMRDGGESQRVPLRTCAWLGGSHGVPFTRASPRRHRWDTAKKGNRMLAPTFDYRQSLKLLRSEIATLNGRIAALLPAQWHQESHCPGWSVADLVMHVVRNGEAFLQFSQRMLADDDTPVCGFGYPDPREVALAGPEGAPRDVAIRNLGPRGCAALQAQQLEDYVALLGGLSEMEQRKTGLWAGMCPRTAPWGCRQRLAEVAYHHWDLRCSLGEEAPLDAIVAREVLTYRLEPSHSPLFRWRPADGAAVQTVRLRCTTDGTAWRISVSAEAVPAVELGWEVPPLPRPGRRLEPEATGPADVELTADISGLTLALSGRGQLDGPHFQLAGPRDAEQRFRAAFTG